jgi:hypothetical protein
MGTPHTQLAGLSAGPGDASDGRRHRVAVVIPCFNEESTVAEVVRQFKAELPTAEVYVFDNNSTDATVARAREACANVFFERRQGKGFVVQSMFRRVDADVYVMVDGDGTYPAQAVHDLVSPVLRGEADMVVGSRLHATSSSHFRFLNRVGNRIFLGLLNAIFGVTFTDLLSGYRAFSRRLVRGLPLTGGGFEIETELTVKALQRGFVITEVVVDLGPRPQGSLSKIRVLHDGALILTTLLSLARDYKPLTFFGCVGLALVAASLVPGVTCLRGYLESGDVAHPIQALVALALAVTGVMVGLLGLVLHTVARRFQELDASVQAFADEVRSGRDGGQA